jgi:hypothetical protein
MLWHLFKRMELLHQWQLTEIDHQRQRAAQQERKKVMVKRFSIILFALFCAL